MQRTSVKPFALTAIGLNGLGAIVALGILVWPGPTIEPGGVPTVAFLVLEPLVNAVLAMAASAVFALPAAVIRLFLSFENGGPLPWWQRLCSMPSF